MPADNEDEALDRRFDELYEIYGRPLETQHRGEFLAISPDGKTILGTTLREVARQATETFGPGNFVFKIGEKAVGRWR